jgi:curved DNA-binding protein CbpA
MADEMANGNSPYGDPYQILELKPDADQKEIRKAYRTLAMKYHPDLNPDDPGAEERFKQVQCAYEALVGTTKKVSAPSGRGQYDHYSEDVHPFMSFFQAARAYYAKKTD